MKITVRLRNGELLASSGTLDGDVDQLRALLGEVLSSEDGWLTLEGDSPGHFVAVAGREITWVGVTD